MTDQNPVREAIERAISEYPVLLFMKGTPEAPACGFSARTVAALQALDAPFAAVDILPDPRIRQELSALSNWPTIPQLFVDGELVGGCDIVTEMYESGELSELLSAHTGGAASAPGPLPDTATSGNGSGLQQIENRLG
jgi:monothiol glutaredoxin